MAQIDLTPAEIDFLLEGIPAIPVAGPLGRLRAALALVEALTAKLEAARKNGQASDEKSET